MKKNICLIVLILLINCSPKKDSNHYNQITEINFIQNIKRQSIKLSEFTDSIEYVMLETNDSCFVKGVDKLKGYADKLILSDEKQIFIFNRKNGKFIKKIGRPGKGPGEFNKIVDFTIVPESEILIILDLGNHLLIKYKLDGTFLGSYYPENIPYKISHISDKIVNLYSLPDFVYNNMYSILITTIDFKPIKRLVNQSTFNIDKKAASHIPSSLISVLDYYNDSLTYWEFNSDTLYRISKNMNAIPRYTFKHDFSNNLEKGKISKFTKIVETEDYIFFLSSADKDLQNLNHYIYNKNSKDIVIPKYNFEKKSWQLRAAFDNDIDNGWPFLPIGNISKNEVYTYFYGFELKQLILENNSQKHLFPQYLINNSILSNPIVMIIKIKKEMHVNI